MNSLSAWIFLSLAIPSALPPEWVHQKAERDFESPALKLAWGRRDPSRERQAAHPWPVSLLSIGHTGASYQQYGFGEAYFHHGLDMRADAGSPIYASAGGKVVNIENYEPGNPLYWEIAILDDDGFLWQYHHVDKASIPDAVTQAFKSGARIPDGALIGKVVAWQISTFGEVYHHIHVNVLDGQKKYQSPFLFLEPLPDMQSPEVKSIGLLKDGKAVNGTQVSAPYSLYSEVTDLILHTKFLVPPHEVSIRVDKGGDKVVWRFDELPGGSSNTDFVSELFVKGMVCGNYQCRKPIVNLGFKNNAFPSSPGAHEIEVRVKDFEGNTAQKTFAWTVN